MCIAIMKREGATIPVEYLEESARVNSDGCGFGWVEDGSLSTFTCMDFPNFLVEYKAVLERCGNIQMLIHFRITSKGDTNLEMCHPFWIDDDHIIIHNGTITNVPKAKLINGRSDTAVFAEEILKGLPIGWEYNESILHILEDYIGWSKVIVMDRWNNITFLNEEKGHWLDDVWYSNKSYMPYVKTYVPAKTSDNYDYYSNYYNQNRTANYTHGRDICGGCNRYFDYSELVWFNKDSLCDKCFKKQTREQVVIEAFVVAEEEAALTLDVEHILEEAERTRENYFFTKDTIVINECNCCEDEFFESELYTVYISAKTIDLRGTKDICAACFKTLYTSDEITSIEILY